MKGKLMSEFIFIYSVCGDSGSFVDVYDLDLNPHGVVCCANCESLVATRESWFAEHGVSV
jgi:hypothetical protein